MQGSSKAASSADGSRVVVLGAGRPGKRKRERESKSKSKSSSTSTVKQKSKSNSQGCSLALDPVKLFRDIPQKVPFIGRPSARTFSVAMPASLVYNVQTDELRNYVIGTIGRIATIYAVNEIVIYNDMDDKQGPEWSDYFATILRFLETPQYLRKFLFPLDEDLKYCGLLNPLDAPHHLRRHEWLPYREGVVELPCKSKSRLLEAEVGLNVKAKVLNSDALMKLYGVGLDFNVEGDTGEGDEPFYQRVTIAFDEASLASFKRRWQQCKQSNVNDDSSLMQFATSSSSDALSGYLVSPDEPQIRAGLYWGYLVRQVDSFDAIFKECPFGEGGYDLKVGTSEHGDVFNASTNIKGYQHAIIVLGPLQGLEHIVPDPSKYFDLYCNFCQGQRSRTIRTEEALSICLATLKYSGHLV